MRAVVQLLVVLVVIGVCWNGVRRAALLVRRWLLARGGRFDVGVRVRAGAVHGLGASWRHGPARWSGQDLVLASGQRLCPLPEGDSSRGPRWRESWSVSPEAVILPVRDLYTDAALEIAVPRAGLRDLVDGMEPWVPRR